MTFFKWPKQYKVSDEKIDRYHSGVMVMAVLRHVSHFFAPFFALFVHIFKTIMQLDGVHDVQYILLVKSFNFWKPFKLEWFTSAWKLMYLVLGLICTCLAWHSAS